jgi:hypothetical protein
MFSNIDFFLQIDAKLDTIKEARRNVKAAKVDFKNCKNEKNKR